MQAYPIGEDVPSNPGSGRSGPRPENIESHRKAIAIGPVALSKWQPNRSTVQAFDGFEQGTITLLKQTLRNVQSEIGIDSDQVRIEGCVVQFGKWNTIRHDRLAQCLISIRHDMRCIQQQRLGQS